MDRAKYGTTDPANNGEPVVAAEDKLERNGRKNYHRKGKRPTGRSGKGVVREHKSKHARRA